MNTETCFHLLAFCMLCGASYLTIALISPPAPLSVDTPATEFSAGRAMQDLEVIAREPHPLGEFPARIAVRDRFYVIISEDSPLLVIILSNKGRTELPRAQGWGLRFDGTPAEVMEITVEFSQPGLIHILLVDEKTGLPSFSRLSTQPQPGTMPSPGEFYPGIPTDFTAIYRPFEVPAFGE